MAALTSIRDGLADNLAANVSRLSVQKRIPSEISGDQTAVIEFAGAPAIRQAMGKGLVELLWIVHVLVPDNGDAGDAEERLDELMATGTGGVWAAIEADVTLNGAADTCTVTEYGPYEWVELEGGIGRYIKGSVSVVVYATGV